MARPLRINTDPISSRERVHLALDHEETDRVPVALVCSGINEPAFTEFDTLLQRERGTSARDFLDSFIDIRYVDAAYVGPPLPPSTDCWGVRREPVSFGVAGYDEIAHYPLASARDVDDIVHHAWPSTDLYDYDSLRNAIAAAQAGREHCLMVSNGNIFETSWYMRGFEQMFMDFVINPELAHAILSRVADFYIEHFTRLLEVADGAVDLAFTADDLAGQTGLLMSLPMWEEFIKPYHVRLNAAIHEFGVKVIYHSDGAVTEAVPGLIDMGIDVLQALQFSADGMDPRHLKDTFGDALCFEGGVSVQTTLPFGTVDEVREETRMLKEVLGKGGGYILGPSHAIQAGTPPENILAMFDTALE
ncbi:uroporphyrinogen decarboxylase family protein [Verrucomicrobiota bacterium]